MQKIDDAYAVISDPEQRNRNNRVWIRKRSRENNIIAYEDQHTAPGKSEAQIVLESYFSCLLEERWIRAYQFLTGRDQKKVTLDDFVAWK